MPTLQNKPIIIDGELVDIIYWIKNTIDESKFYLFSYFENQLVHHDEELEQMATTFSLEVLQKWNLELGLHEKIDLFGIAILAVCEACNFHAEMEYLIRKWGCSSWPIELAHYQNPGMIYGPSMYLRDLNNYRKEVKSYWKIPKIDEFINNIFKL